MKIEWIITDELINASKQEFDLEWNGIYGHFQMTINDKKGRILSKSGINSR